MDGTFVTDKVLFGVGMPRLVRMAFA